MKVMQDFGVMTLDGPDSIGLLMFHSDGKEVKRVKAKGKKGKKGCK